MPVVATFSCFMFLKSFLLTRMPGRRSDSSVPLPPPFIPVRTLKYVFTLYIFGGFPHHHHSKPS